MEEGEKKILIRRQAGSKVGALKMGGLEPLTNYVTKKLNIFCTY